MFQFGKKFYKLFFKDNNTYIIMHGNVECCIFTVNDSYNEIEKYEIFNRKHTPVEIKDNKTLLKWINKRLIPANRIQ